jgi:uncharacterized protein YcbX
MLHEGTAVGNISALYRYPVKSTAGQALQAAAVTARGLRHDREWAAYTEDGGIASGKRTRRFRPVIGLMNWASMAEDDDDVPLLVSPEGIRYQVDDPGASEALTAVFGQELTLRHETTIQHHDESPLHLLTTSSLAAVEVPRQHHRRHRLRAELPRRRLDRLKARGRSGGSPPHRTRYAPLRDG